MQPDPSLAGVKKVKSRPRLMNVDNGMKTGSKEIQGVTWCPIHREINPKCSVCVRVCVCVSPAGVGGG